MFVLVLWDDKESLDNDKESLGNGPFAQHHRVRTTRILMRALEGAKNIDIAI